ncbi:adenosylcobinamide amidohydrolase [Phascolarctobacterium succinatutens]|uniref:adenosylcobinamide amidohydrolase n=1 Tax=Phascolarctobacterium succinatutens TaxID=626940 RepID=UPI0026E9650C|nr:adenosylcobinamide amidohydrolase [Phascolarctobacterium succinatutens]
MSEHLCTLSTGDKVYFYDKSIVIYFQGARKVLSTSLYNGGYHDDYTAVYNYDAKQGAGMPCEMLADTYVEHMRLVSKRLALDPDKVSGMGTAASMENAVVETLSFKELTVTAIVTGGIETNGGRAGDPADYYKPMPKPKYGTINIMLLLDCDMPEGTMARAIVTCTEAKTAAIQELLEGSKYSNGIATGSGTDQTIIIANSESELYMEGAGKHSKLGELIGKTVKNAVKKALAKQSGLTPAKQHDVFRRLKRFDIKAGDMWQSYSAQDAVVVKPEYLLAAEKLATEDIMLVYTSLYAHLLDQYLWELISAKEMQMAGQQLLKVLAEQYAVEAELIDEGTLAAMLAAWQKQFNKIIAHRLQPTAKES